MKFEKIESFQSETGQLTNRYYLKSLEPGQAITIGNALRRVLLTEIEGTAISEVRFYDINHEYGAMPGVREDVLEILLNLKHLKFQGIIKEPCLGTIELTGPIAVTGRNLKLPQELRVINLNHYIAFVSEKTNLKLEVRIESGKGYILSDDKISPRTEDFFTIDAIFTPIINVNFTIKDLYRFDEQSVEDLDLLICTDGSITPDEALSLAAKKLTNLFGSLVVCEPKVSATSEIESESQTLIETLQLSVRAYNCLKRENIRTIDDLKEYSIKELKEIKNFGEKCANEVISKLRDRFDIILE